MTEEQRLELIGKLFDLENALHAAASVQEAMPQLPMGLPGDPDNLRILIRKFLLNALHCVQEYRQLCHPE